MTNSHPQPKRPQILLGLTGGIAAYKAAELVRRLADLGIDCQVVMTTAACEFITPATLQALSGQPVYTDLWDPRINNGMAHIDLTRDKQAIVIAPATANFIAKTVHGLADDLLSTLCLARECPLLIAPAMNRQMWEHPATQRNITQLEADGITVLGPASGDQACGEVGMGRMLEAAELAEAINAYLAPKTLAGVFLLMTAGPTFEPIDAVRGITNRSSGKMGYALARAAIAAGARVTLISGPVSLMAPVGARVIAIETADQMFAAVQQEVAGADIFISVAAVADYRVSEPQAHKIKKTDTDTLSLSLVPNVDILKWVAEQVERPFCVGFAAESQHVHAYADDKRRRKQLDLIIANLAQTAIGADDNEVTLIDDTGSQTLPRAAKTAIASQLISHIAERYLRQKR
jgi:phosphopantothenoylcysteine decarboxylase/phosphopantothenate--cysteine ligase